MNFLPAIGFATPLALAGLLSLPVIWWLLRFTPPRPDRIAFPPIRLLLGLADRLLILDGGKVSSLVALGGKPDSSQGQA